MIFGFDTAALLDEGLEAWAFVRRLVEGWTRPLAPGDGWSEADLDKAEGLLGVRLPSALRTVYGLLGKRFDLTRCQDDLLTPYQCHWDDTGEVLVFRAENQGCAHWGIRRADFGAEDPPVVYRAGKGWQPFLSHTSLACVEMLLFEIVFGGELFNACELPVDLAALGYRRLAFPEYPTWADPTGSPVRWYAGPGKLLRQETGWIFVRGQTPEDLRALCTTIPGDWTVAHNA
jgi:hypothetical protein